MLYSYSSPIFAINYVLEYLNVIAINCSTEFFSECLNAFAKLFAIMKRKKHSYINNNRALSSIAMIKFYMINEGLSLKNIAFSLSDK